MKFWTLMLALIVSGCAGPQRTPEQDAALSQRLMSMGMILQMNRPMVIQCQGCAR
jgi:Flp pilus assembly protein TadD